MNAIKPVERHQADGQQDTYSLLSGHDFSQNDTARQEFKDDTDVNRILARFGVGGAPQRQVYFSEVDYDLDLQTAYSAAQAARQMYAKLPAELRKKYGSWPELLNALQSGQARIDLTRKEEPPAPTDTP